MGRRRARGMPPTSTGLEGHAPWRGMCWVTPCDGPARRQGRRGTGPPAEGVWALGLRCASPRDGFVVWYHRNGGRCRNGRHCVGRRSGGRGGLCWGP